MNQLLYFMASLLRRTLVLLLLIEQLKLSCCLRNMIEIKNIKKSFGDKVIIDDISAVMETGKCNLIIGASGSGKTVLTKCMIGLFKPDSGEIFYDGENMLSMDDEERKKLRQQIGMLFQGSALFDSMTVEQNIMFPLNMFTI